MPILKFSEVTIVDRYHPLLDNVSFNVNAGDKIALIGRNGSGKTTLFRAILGQYAIDDGIIWKKPELKIGILTQALPDNTELTVYDFVASGIEHLGSLLQQYHPLSQQVALSQTTENLQRLEQLQHEIDAQQGWNIHYQIESTLSRLELPLDIQLKELSGGWQRRATLAKALVAQPDLLLLDEPTNHLDVTTIEWLENQLKLFQGAIICISHDRTFLDRFPQQIFELDRGHIYQHEGNLTQFEKFKAQRLHAEQKQQAEFQKKLHAEEVWIRQGIKARRTRNEGRVVRLKALREEKKAYRQQQNQPSFNLQAVQRSGKLVIRAEHIDYTIGTKQLIQDFSIHIMRGDRIGLIGPNGCGKTTLIKLLLQELIPTHGTVELGSQLNIAYFDQMRQSLDMSLSVEDNVAGGREQIELGGKSKHVISYLADFLFTPERARTLAKNLSGGEQNRLLLAKLFSLPHNFLVLDEPTNDLDIESLELLEELLIDYSGTILLVSHDRTFMDNVVSSLLVFSKQGKIIDFIGSYSDWAENNTSIKKTNTPSLTTHDKKSKSAAIKTPQKLSYHLQKELEELPLVIENLEKEIKTLQEEISQPAFYRQTQDITQQTLKKLQTLEQQLEEKYARWETLDNTHY